MVESSWRVLALAPTSFFADYGCHVRIWGQLRALRRQGHSVALLTYPSGRDVPDFRIFRPPFLRQQSLQVGSSWQKFLLDALLFPAAIRTVRRWRPDLLHAYLHEGGFLGHWLARLFHLPLFMDVQGSLTAEMLTHRFLSPRSPLLASWQRLERWIDHQPALLFASSTQMRRALHDKFGLPGEKVRLLLDSVDPGQLRPRHAWPAAALQTWRRQLSLPADRPIVAYLGLLAPYQGIDLLLQAVQRLCPAGKSRQARTPHFLVMGFPFVERYRHMAAQLGVSDCVTFTGTVPYADAPRYLALADLAVSPKLPGSEGSGKLLPYMATGLPVVAVESPAARDYLGAAGYYAEPEPGALAAMLHQALTDAGAPDRGARLRREAETKFTWQTAAAIIATGYQDVITASKTWKDRD